VLEMVKTFEEATGQKVPYKVGAGPGSSGCFVLPGALVVSLGVSWGARQQLQARGWGAAPCCCKCWLPLLVEAHSAPPQRVSWIAHHLACYTGHLHCVDRLATGLQCWYPLLTTAALCFSLLSPLQLVDRREGDAEAVWAGTELAEKMLGWKARFNLTVSSHSCVHGGTV
jgi:hypothetical protein